MFGIGLPELIVIIIIALVVVGPERLPDLVRTLGRSVGDLRRAANEVRTVFDEEEQRLAEEVQKARTFPAKPDETTAEKAPQVKPEGSPDGVPTPNREDDA